MNRVNTIKLHRLIKSLKKEEKRFFKLFTKKQKRKEEVFYLKIFDYLDKLEVVDREKFKKKFKGVKGLSGLQNYLYKLILKSLRNQPAYQDVDAVLREGLADLAILFQKELLVEVEEKNQELLELAILHDKVFFLPIFYDWWFVLHNTRFRYANIEASDFDENTQRYEATIKALNAFYFYRTHTGKLMYTVEGKNSRQAFDAVLAIKESLPVYSPQENTYGITTRAQELQLRKMLGNVLMDPNDSYCYSHQLYEELKQQPQEVFEHCKLYYYSSLISMLNFAPSIDQMHIIIEEIESTVLKYPKNIENKNIHMHVLLGKMDIHLLLGDFEQFDQLLIDNKEKVAFIKNYSHSHYRSLFHYKKALYHYAKKEYYETLIIIDDFLLKKEVNSLIKNPSLLLKMIIYYEEEEYVLLTSLLKNLRRLLRKNELLLETEKGLIDLLNNLIKLPKQEHKEKMIAIRKKMVEQISNSPNYKEEFLTFFNYIGWIDHQIDGSPFKQLFFRHTGVIEVGEAE
ncbi:hypothetical protein [Aureispira sp. CCB-E]|uniref:hypothetical protein n=1 Tax=Aureispira sp. CCB-E TaxID=3051121 RepID=UPI0028691BB5|nr:hypothetical protein [Aureispira sp. CCB-E]WMX16121.1 hypothetical protein QP953_07055 [Aureispira sp. CCB-E]